MLSKNIDELEHHPAIEEISKLLCDRIQNPEQGYFRVKTAYFLSNIAASMRATIKTEDRGTMPVNCYAVLMAPSGFGKGFSLNILENEIFAPFRKRYMQDTYPTISDTTLWKHAIEKAALTGQTEQEEYDKFFREWSRYGDYVFSFDSGSSPAIKQLRQKLLLSGTGSLNLEIDEFGSNLLANTEALTVYFELYDQGRVKQKLTKNSADNLRGSYLEGSTPANALLFGTPAKIFDGDKVEENFYSFLQIGYARRCLFGWGDIVKARQRPSPEEAYQQRVNARNSKSGTHWATHFAMLADPAKHGWEMEVDATVGTELEAYSQLCQSRSYDMPPHEEIRQSEMTNRPSKTLKLAGALAFVDESVEITMDHLYGAIKLVEEAGESFEKMLTRDAPYMKLAKYIADFKGDLTHADLTMALPFYKSSPSTRKALMMDAMAWGYKNHIVIKKSYVEGSIELFSGEKLKETNVDELILSYSDHVAYNFKGERAPFDKLHLLTQAPGPLHWCNHHFEDNHRLDEKAIQGFNMVVLDCDGGIPLTTVHEILKDYRFMTYTTKRHSDDENRFRVILPINYELKLDQNDYREFMNNVMQWFPFPSDEGANQRARKWETFEGGTYHYNTEGTLLDCLKFIPKTSRNELYQKEIQPLESLDNLERWFAQEIAIGNRNNNMIKYALALFSQGMSYTEIENQVLGFNARLPNPLAEQELRSTVLVTVAKRLSKAA